MTVTRDELDSFNRFVTEKMNNGAADLSLDYCLAQWRAERERAEVIAQIQQSVEDIEAGRYYTLEEVDEHIRFELGLSPRPQ